MSNLVVSQATSLAKALSVDASNTQELITTLKATAFKGQVSDAQMAALLIVAQQYGLNPWCKEIYAFPDRNNGIVPVVGVDGWSRIINSHPQFDGMEFQQDDESCTCTIFRKDRKHPVSVTEFMSECKREGVGPWKSHPKRMLRHKATIQCARLAFGFVGIYEQDEAERIVEADYTVVNSGGVAGRAGAAAASAVQQITPPDSPERETAIKEAKEVASLGVKRFREYWPTLSKEQRQLIADKLPEFQQVAEEADSKAEAA